MIKLTQLLKEDGFAARAKHSGKLVYFKSKEGRDNAIKAGTHEDPKKQPQSKDTQSQKPAGAGIFGGDYQSQRGGGDATTQKSKVVKKKLSPKKIKSDLRDLKGTKGMDVAKAILAGDKDIQKTLGLKDNQYNNLLKKLAKIGGHSGHHDEFRSNNYSTNDLEKWAKERLDQTLAKVKPSKPRTQDDVIKSLHRQVNVANSDIHYYSVRLKNNPTDEFAKNQLEQYKKKAEVAKNKLKQYGGYDDNYDTTSNSVKAIKQVVSSLPKGAEFGDIYAAVKKAKDKTKQIKFGWNGGKDMNGVEYFEYPPMDQEYYVFNTSTPKGREAAEQTAKQMGVQVDKLNDTMWGVDVSDSRPNKYTN